ncbi:hypothetical protein GF371_05040 [Candidatus Woesearchaeota archaeon]|nr:hypothetical protein [Candidatus Woesearchaeota archaeon]
MIYMPQGRISNIVYDRKSGRKKNGSVETISTGTSYQILELPQRYSMDDIVEFKIIDKKNKIAKITRLVKKEYLI